MNDILAFNFHVGNIEITNMNTYLEGMSKGLSDKLFFLNMIELDLLIDFGAADGSILNYISDIKPNMKLVGYDIDKYMINIAKDKYKHIQFEHDWNIIEKIIEQNKKLKIGVLYSSVIHEVYSYSTSKVISNFWKTQVFNPNVDYVIIRDMISLNSYDKMNLIDAKKVRKKSNQEKLAEYESIWGNIEYDFKILLHWLLKCRYVINWTREVRENYMPVTLEHLKKKWIPSNWKIYYEKTYTLKFLKDEIKKDFDVDLNEPTHLKMIIKNVKFIE